MEGKEPATGLVDSFCNEVGREEGIKLCLVFEWIVNLGKRHGSRIKPYIDQIQLAHHFHSVRRNQEDVVHEGTVQIYFFVIFRGVVANNEILVRVGSHETGSHRLFNFANQLLHRADAKLLCSVFGSPDGKGSSPIPRAREVPVDQVLQPVAKTTGSC